MFCEAWESQLCDMALLLREINDIFEGKRGASPSSRLGGGATNVGKIHPPTLRKFN